MRVPIHSAFFAEWVGCEQPTAKGPSVWMGLSLEPGTFYHVPALSLERQFVRQPEVHNRLGRNDDVAVAR
jgi:hypothetical protein